MGPDKIYSWKNNTPDKSCTLKWWGFNISIDILQARNKFYLPWSIKTLILYNCNNLQNSAHDTNMYKEWNLHTFFLKTICTVQFDVYIPSNIYKICLYKCMSITICFQINMSILCTMYELVYSICSVPCIHVMISYIYDVQQDKN